MTKVIINGADQDAIQVAGTPTIIFTVVTGARYNVRRNSSGEAVDDEQKFVRYFPKSGTYRVKWIFTRSSNGGIIDMGLDTPAGNNIFDGITHWVSGATTFNHEEFTTIEVARGNHDISLTTEADGGTSDFREHTQLIQFDLIDEHTVLGGGAPTQRAGMKLLTYTELDASSATILTDVFPTKKFLWCRAWFKGTTSSSVGDTTMTVGNGTVDTGTNYATRRNKDASSETTTTTDANVRIMDDAGADDIGQFIEFYIINILDQEKLIINHGVFDTATGAGTSPSRYESVHKWDDLTKQINVLRLTAVTAFEIGSFIEVWGCD